MKDPIATISGILLLAITITLMCVMPAHGATAKADIRVTCRVVYGGHCRIHTDGKGRAWVTCKGGKHAPQFRQHQQGNTITVLW